MRTGVPKETWHAQVAATLVAYWRERGVDRTPRERQLFLHGRNRLGRRINTYNVGLILRRLVKVGVLAMDDGIGRAVEFRLRRPYAFPLWPGFARDVEEILGRGRVHAWPDGTCSAIGTDDDGRCVDVKLLTSQHFFDEFASYRGAFHAATRGLDLRRAEHEHLVAAAIDAAPILAARAVVAEGDTKDLYPAARKIAQESPFWRAVNNITHTSDPEGDRRSAVDLLRRFAGLYVGPGGLGRKGDVPKARVCEALAQSVTQAIDGRIACLDAQHRDFLKRHQLANGWKQEPECPRHVQEVGTLPFLPDAIRWSVQRAQPTAVVRYTDGRRVPEVQGTIPNC